MTNFPKEQFNSDELLNLFDSAEIQMVDGDVFKSVIVQKKDKLKAKI
jgi:hypothetical protein